MLDGFARVNDLAQTAKSHGAPALAITEHGNLYSLLPFAQACKEIDLKPIFGVEAYVAPESRFEKNSREMYHLVLLAKNRVGLGNLYHLVTLANQEGFYYKPRVDRELLYRYREGIVCLSACLAGQVNQMVLQDKMSQAEEIAAWYKDTYQDDYYLEIQRHPGEDFERALRGTVQIARRLDIPLVATTDAHYTRKEDSFSHRLVVAIGTRNRLGLDTDMGEDYYLKSPQEMAELFADLPEALHNTLVVAEKVERYSLEEGVGVPPVPGIQPGDEPAVLRERVSRSLESRYGSDPLYQERMEHELKIIGATGFERYLLLVADVCAFARSRGIRFGPRGSAAASLVCHALDISQPDPLKHDLIFERFINPARLEPPDIDLDFQHDRREEIASYLMETYHNVAAITTFGTLGAKALVKDVGRSLGLPFMFTNQVSQSLPPSSSLKDFQSNDPAICDLVEKALPLEGLHRHASTHAAGLVVCDRPLVEVCALGKAGDLPQVQLDMEGCTKLGLLKLDVLGLDYLTVLDRCLKMIGPLDPWHFPSDPKVYDMLCRGRVHGVFQLGSSGMRSAVVQIKPSCLDDLMAIVALYRPGPMEHIPRYAAVKHGTEKMHSPHPLIDDIVAPTKGLVVFQEQVTQIVRRLGGYSYAEADILRKAIGKKKKDLLLAQREQFLRRTVAHSAITEGEASSVWAYFEPFADYAFNKSHSCCYGALAYQTAYLKANYPLQYMTALLDVHADDRQKVAADVAECLAIGVRVLPPHATHSQPSCSIQDGAIRLGLNTVKGVTDSAAQTVQDNAPYLSYVEVARKLKAMPLTALESLVKVGAFDPLNRARLLLAIQSYRKAFRKERPEQASFWSDELLAEPPLVEESEEIPQWERDLLGICLSDSALQQAMLSEDSQPIADLTEGPATLVGQLQNPKVVFTKKNKEPMLIAQVQDTTGVLDLVVFPRVYPSHSWDDGQIMILEGKVDSREDKLQLIVEKARPYIPVNIKVQPTLTVHSPSAWLGAWQRCLDRPGEVSVKLCYGRLLLEGKVSNLECLRQYGDLC